MFFHEKRSYNEASQVLIACPDGHIDDFPWSRWVHGENENNCDGGSGDLYLLSSAQADLTGVYVQCKKCKKRISCIC